MYGAFQDHELEKLTLVDICFSCSLFSFLILSFDIIFFYKKISFVVFFNFFSVRLSSFYGIDHWFCELIQGGLPLIA
jgi:hypothetical protein